MPAPHDEESDPHHPGFIDDNYGKELRPIEAEYNLPQDDDPPQDSFFDNQGLASIDPKLYGMSLHGGSWDDFLFEQLPPQASHKSYRQLRYGGQLRRPQRLTNARPWILTTRYSMLLEEVCSGWGVYIGRFCGTVGLEEDTIGMDRRHTQRNWDGEILFSLIRIGKERYQRLHEKLINLSIYMYS
jgi:hypothetical protein